MPLACQPTPRLTQWLLILCAASLAYQLDVAGNIILCWIAYFLVLSFGTSGFIRWLSAPTTFHGDWREQRPWFLI